MDLSKYQHQLDWLMEGDPSIQYFTLKDLLDGSSREIEQVQNEITKQGWGKQLLDLQDPEGTWDKGLYTPKWTSTTYTLLLLKRLGAKTNDAIKKGCYILLDEGIKENGGFTLWKSVKDGEVCVTGMLLSAFCHFGIKDARLYDMADYLICRQMPDGGWNCNDYRGATHSSFHTTMSALEGLWEFQKKHDSDSALVESCQDEGINFFAEHKLYQSHRTGETVDPKMTRFTFPPRWRYDIMKFFDYAADRKIAKDERFKSAVDIIRKKETKDGFWKLAAKHGGRQWFEMENGRDNSRIATLRSLRALKWWEDIN